MTEETKKILDSLKQKDGNWGELYTRVYSELHTIAQRHMNKEHPSHTLQPTLLVNEAYTRLMNKNNPPVWESRAHFCGYVSGIMRNILLEHHRKRKQQVYVQIDKENDFGMSSTENQILHLLDLDKALTGLSSIHARSGKIAEMRLIIGMTLEETTECLGIKRTTAQNDWTFAKAYLAEKLGNKLTIAK